MPPLVTVYLSEELALKKKALAVKISKTFKEELGEIARLRGALAYSQILDRRKEALKEGKEKE